MNNTKDAENANERMIIFDDVMKFIVECCMIEAWFHKKILYKEF